MAAFLALCALDPVVNVFAEHRARTTQLDPRWLGGQVWGRFLDDRMVAALHVGANVVPVNCLPSDLRLFASMLRTHGRERLSLVGPRELVALLAEEMVPQWGQPREVRMNQPLLLIDRDPLVEPDPTVRFSGPDDFDELYPACVAMYTEEVGVSPEEGGAADMYRARVRQLIGRRWSFARYDTAGRVEFKAEVGCASPGAAQIQGVWVRPDLRGQGIAAPAMAAAVALVRRHVAPVASLYVNDFNVAARATYAKVGFTQHGTFATVLF